MKDSSTKNWASIEFVGGVFQIPAVHAQFEKSHKGGILGCSFVFVPPSRITHFASPPVWTNNKDASFCFSRCKVTNR